MRLRKVKNALERLEENKKYFVSNPEEYKGKWASLFANDNELNIEIGSGKGKFITSLALANPNINYIGIEKYDSVLLRCNELALKSDIPNLRLILIDAASIKDYFAPEEVDAIYLNFSDPWPKTCHAKRRLTSPLFLNNFKDILKASGQIRQKTDNRGLFEYSLESLNSNGWALSDISLDLHNDPRYPENITTEFEEKWSKLGPIYRLVATKK